MAYESDVEITGFNEEPSEPEEPKKSEDKYLPDVNLVTQLMKTDSGKAALKKMSQDIRDDFDTGWESTEGYRQRTAKDWDLVCGILPTKDAPYAGCANIHVPVALENLCRLYFRAYEEAFGDWTNVFSVVPVGSMDDNIADLLTLHGNWQLREQIRDFPRQMHRGMFCYFFIGDVSGESSYDPLTGLNRHEVLTPDDFLVPYTSVTTQPDYSDVPWTVRILRLYRHDLEARRDDWVDVDKLLGGEPPSFSDEPNEPLAEHATESSEQEISEEQRVKPYKLLKYEGFLELPGENRLRYVQAIVHHEKGHIFSLKLHEQENWQDKLRFQAQSVELQAYREAMHMRAEMVMQAEEQQTQIADMEAQGLGGPLNNMAMMGDLNQAQELPMPQAPAWLAESDTGEPAPVRMDPIRLYVHAVCIEPLKGNLGLSYGRMQADHNRAVNTLMDQVVDSATFASVPCFVGTVKFEREFEFKPGKFNIAKGATPDELRNSFIPIQSGGPNPAMFQTIEFVMQTASSSMQSPNVLSGEPGKSGEPYKGLAARIEQASKQLGTLTRKFVFEFVQPIVRNNALLNSMFLKNEEIMEVTNHATGVALPIKVGREMYARNYSVVFRADMRFTSQTERVAEADEALKMVMSIPPLQMNQALVYAAIKKSFQARGLHDLIRLMGKPPLPQPDFTPPPPPMPPGQPGMQPGAQSGGPPNGAPQPSNGQQMPAQGMA
jgi:hypothetical protein